MKKQIRIYIYIIGLILIDQLSKVWADEEIYTTSYQLCIDHGRSVWKSDRQSIQGICG